MEGVDVERVLAEAEQYARRSKALLPLRPVFMGSDHHQTQDWPMINMRAKEAERAAALFQQRKMQPEMAGAEGDEGFFDAKEYHTSNK
jgi:hypothetical protein